MLTAGVYATAAIVVICAFCESTFLLHSSQMPKVFADTGYYPTTVTCSIHTKLPRTGQAMTFRANDDGLCQSGFYGTRFSLGTAANAGTVFDNALHLQWQQNPYGPSDWSTDLKYCRNTTLNGKTGWRAPTAFEMTSLVDWNSTTVPFFAAAGFTLEPGYYAWTSTTMASSATNAYALGAGTAEPLLTTLGKANGEFVYCVRPNF